MYNLPENFHRNFHTNGKRSCLVDMFQTQIHVLFVNLSLIPVSGLRGRKELVCAHVKRDPGIKFTGLEFCLPFAQTVNSPVLPCKWPWETVNNLYFRM